MQLIIMSCICLYLDQNAIRLASVNSGCCGYTGCPIKTKPRPRCVPGDYSRQCGQAWSAIVARKGDYGHCRRKRRQIVAQNGDNCRRFRRL